MNYSTSKLYLSKKSLANNYDFIRKCVGDNVVVSSVVKGNAYGHGISHFVPMAMSCGVRHFSVFSSDEAYHVHQTSDGKAEIMIMGDISPEAIPWVVEQEVQCFVFEKDRLNQILDYCKKHNKIANIHIEVETGLNRTGFDESLTKEIIDLIKSNHEYLSIEGICTHLSGAESVANRYRIQHQLVRFDNYYNTFLKNDIIPKRRHVACSAAMMSYPETHMDMVRVGIIQYGFWPSSETFIEYISKNNLNGRLDPLRRVISWKSQIMSIKNVARGEFIGYGTSFLAHQDMRVAVVPVGYSHGYSRTLSNQGRALINGVRVGVIGLVNMNMMMLDITEVETNIGDEVILIGGDDDLQISVASFSELSNQLNYELLTRIPERIPRLIIE